MNFDIVVDGALVTGASVILAFVLNQAYTWLRGKFEALPELTEKAKKTVVFLVAAGLAGYSGLRLDVALPDPAADPALFATTLLAFATAVFKAAQVVYDRVWSALLEA